MSFNAAEGGRASGQGPTTFQHPRGAGEHAGKQSAALALELCRGFTCMFEMHKKLTLHMCSLLSLKRKTCSFFSVSHFMHMQYTLLCFTLKSALLKGILKYLMRQESVTYSGSLVRIFKHFLLQSQTQSKQCLSDCAAFKKGMRSCEQFCPEHNVTLFNVCFWKEEEHLSPSNLVRLQASLVIRDTDSMFDHDELQIHRTSLKMTFQLTFC